MMNTKSLLQIGIGSIAIAFTTSFIPPASAAVYEARVVEQENFIAVAVPYGKQYNLLVIEQIPGQQQCWREQGSQPTVVEPLLLNFDFTHSCRRSTDPNGYSMRIEDRDYGMEYLLTIVERSDELQLVAVPYNRQSKPIVIGRTKGIAPGMLKIELDPDWQFSRRTYQGKTLGHVYFHNQQLNPNREAVASSSSESQTNSTTPKKEIVFTAPGNNQTESDSAATTDIPNLPPDPALDSVNVNSTSESVPVSTSNISNSSNTQYQSLSDIMDLSNPTVSTDTNKLPVPPAPLPLDNTNQPPTTSAAVNSNSSYRVVVPVANSQQSDQVKSLFPDSFRTIYQGQSMLQVGKFSNPNNAYSAVQSLEKLGLSPTVLAD